MAYVYRLRASTLLQALVALLFASSLMMALDNDKDAARLARISLSKELGVGEDAIAVEAVTPATWRDGSLGCPRKGMVYPQVVREGYRVALRAGDKSYMVHVAGQQVVVCQDGADLSASESTIGAAARISQLARQDLASRLQVDPRQIRVNFVRPTVWPDASLGCAEPDKSYTQTITRGFVVELRYEGKTHRYHSDVARVVNCEKASPR